MKGCLKPNTLLGFADYSRMVHQLVTVPPKQQP